MKHRTVIAAVTAVLLSAAPASAQGIGAVLGAMAQGGGWIQIPIERGNGSLLSAALPSVGLEIAGCMQIWAGHSGSWTVSVEDTYGNGDLNAEAEPGDDIPFSYSPGAWAQLKVDVAWSEPRDTTLLVWVGVEGSASRDPCDPVYGTGGR